ncbi:TVP38/TMEM64 family protein [Litoribacter ruber]|uniref:TVP38/TMEM64 family membrane protein n=1 Tax=Litoribacter ruber TaxID=702568 RepID=A0AAP2CH12_9BACT|nr:MULTISPECIES: TVP38/TMEM64 family protein [Litoribacter]MBS9524523.1 TVP38/TMEM64 family protein [Litoribacter alkaliphilus]MBT0810317.1 TVP38/TMEM64 family protein [Litoribacter ruber]
MVEKENRSKSKSPIYLSLILLIGIILLYLTVPAVENFVAEAYEVLSSGDEKKISDWVDQFGWAGPLVLILAMTAQMVVLVVPTPLLMVIAVLAYGPLIGSGIILIGIFIASSIAYVLGSALGNPVVEKLLGHKSKNKMKGFLKNYGFWAVIIVRFSPFLSNDAISLVAGIMKMGFWKFIAATMLGILPLTLLIAYFEESESLQTGLIWIGAISFVGFVVYVWIDKNRKTNNYQT